MTSWPAASVAVRTGTNRPATVYRWEIGEPFIVGEESPKFQLKTNGGTPPSAVATNVTVSGPVLDTLLREYPTANGATGGVVLPDPPDPDWPPPVRGGVEPDPP